MSLLNSIRSAIKKPKTTPIPTTQVLMGALAVAAAAGHHESLKKSVLEEWASLNTAGVPSDAQWGQAMAELLVAYFCLCSMHAHGSLEDAIVASLYCTAMLARLRGYESPENPHWEAFVRAVFEDQELLDSVVNGYLKQIPSSQDRATVEECRVLLKIFEGNPVHFVSSLLHLRLMRRLGIDKRDLRFMYLSIANTMRVNGFCKDVLSKTVPVLVERAV